MEGIDLNPIIEQLIGLISAILLALSAWIGILIRAWVAQKIQMNRVSYQEQLQSMYNEAAQRSMAYAESVVPGGVPKKGAKSDAFVKAATTYLVKFWPEVVDRMGLDESRVQQTIIARLPSGEETVKADAIAIAKAGGAPAQDIKS